MVRSEGKYGNGVLLKSRFICITLIARGSLGEVASRSDGKELLRHYMITTDRRSCRAVNANFTLVFFAQGYHASELCAQRHASLDATPTAG